MIEVRITQTDNLLSLEFFNTSTREVVCAYIHDKSVFMCKENGGEIVLQYEIFGTCALHALKSLLTDNSKDHPRTKEFSKQVTGK